MSHQTILRRHFETWKLSSLNPSLRNFSRYVGISSATLSQVMSGKRPLTLKAARKFSERCALSAAEKQKLFNAIVEGGEGDHDLESLEMETFSAIKDWYHYAILGLASLEQNRLDPHWVSRKIGISHNKAADAIRRLIKLELIIPEGRGFRQSSGALTIESQARSAAIQSYHRQNLINADKALGQFEPIEREFGAVTIAIDDENIDEAKELIREFRRNLMRTLDKGKKNKVYTCAVQFFPVHFSE